MSQIINQLRYNYNATIKPIMSGLAHGMILPFWGCYTVAQDMISNLVRDYRNNNLSLKSIGIFVAYILYCLFYVYRISSNVFEIYNVGYYTAYINDLTNNKNYYLFLLGLYILYTVYLYSYKPIYRRFKKAQVLKQYFTTVIDLFHTINIKNNDKRTNQIYCKYILENQTTLVHINPLNQKFEFIKFTPSLDGEDFDINSFEILEYNSNKLDFNSFQLEYLFFDYNSTTKTYFSRFYNDDLIKNYPKLAKKILTHCNTMNERINYLKTNTPICDDIINHIITKY